MTDRPPDPPIHRPLFVTIGACRTGDAVRRAIVSAFLAFVALWALAACSTTGAGTAIQDTEATNALPIPELLEADDRGRFELIAQPGRSGFARADTDAATIGINGSYLGPTLRMQRGDKVSMAVRNDLAEMTTLHWHGLHVPARMDGGPHQMIEPGRTWRPHWRVDQPAATLWYHSHPHGQTAQQVYRGLAGLLLVEDPKEAPAGLPDRYGVDDVPLVVQDKTFTPDGELVVDVTGRSSTGFLGDTVVVNGVVGPYRDVTTESVRLRLLNASNARFYNFGFSDDRSFSIVAGDGGLLARPVVADRVQLSPGERAEIVVRFAPGETIDLKSFPPDLGHSIGTSDRFGGGTFTVVQFRAAQQLTASPQLPSDLADVAPPNDPGGTPTRTFGMTDRAINGAPMDMGRIDEVVPENTEEVWAVTNQNPQPHNFHVHDGSFRVLTIDGEPPPPELAGYKDTVYVAPRSTVRLLVKFSDYADPEWPYMYHCHLLLHEDMGIMGQFVVVRPGQKVVPPPRPQSHNLMPGMPSPSAPAVAPTADASTPSHDVHSLRRGSVDPG